MRRERLLLLLSLTANALLLATLFYGLNQLGQARLAAAKERLSVERWLRCVRELETAAKSAAANKPTLTDAEMLELARLRNEVTRLRTEQRAAAITNSAATRRPLAPAPALPPPSQPVTKLTSTVSAQVPLGHALALGGWASPTPGKRIVGLLTPEVDASAPGSVLVTTRLIEFPDAAMEQLGLQGLRTGETNSQGQAHFTAEQLAALLKWAEQETGVDILSAPRVVTNNGQAAQISVTQAQPDGTQTGPVLKLTPTLDTTGTSVQLDVGLELNLPVKP